MKKPISIFSPRPWMTAALGAALLVGCGGGGGSDGAADMSGDMAGGASIPDGALASSAAYTQFTLMMSAQSGSESAEPLSADKVAVPPASETDEPLPLG